MRSDGDDDFPIAGSAKTRAAWSRRAANHGSTRATVILSRALEKSVKIHPRKPQRRREVARLTEVAQEHQSNVYDPLRAQVPTTTSAGSGQGGYVSVLTSGTISVLR
jgi:hypothetical protein